MSTTLEHTTVEHPTPEQAPPPDRWKRGVGVVALVLALGTVIIFDLIQQGPADVGQETFSPEVHRDWTPPRTDSGDVGANQLRSEATRGSQVSESSNNQLRSEATRGSQVSEFRQPSNKQLGVEATGGSPDTQQAVIAAMIAEGFYGLSPASAQAADTDGGVYPGLYAADELNTMRLAREGKLPKELLEAELFVTKRLVNEGRIPAATVR